MDQSLFSSDSSIQPLTDRSELTFAYPRVGQTTIAGLSIKQTGVAAPVTLSVSNSSWFTIAHNLNESTFVASLSFMPPPEGYRVYIRYTPQSIRGHSSFLIATTPHEVQTVLLKGLPTRLWSWFLLS